MSKCIYQSRFERYAVVIKLLNNESSELYGFAVPVNLDRSSGRRVFCEGSSEKR